MGFCIVCWGFVLYLCVSTSQFIPPPPAHPPQAPRRRRQWPEAVRAPPPPRPLGERPRAPLRSAPGPSLGGLTSLPHQGINGQSIGNQYIPLLPAPPPPKGVYNTQHICVYICKYITIYKKRQRHAISLSLSLSLSLSIYIHMTPARDPKLCFG